VLQTRDQEQFHASFEVLKR